jgi:hypothetical protein
MGIVVGLLIVLLVVVLMLTMVPVGNESRPILDIKLR